MGAFATSEVIGGGMELFVSAGANVSGTTIPIVGATINNGYLAVSALGGLAVFGKQIWGNDKSDATNNNRISNNDDKFDVASSEDSGAVTFQQEKKPKKIDFSKNASSVLIDFINWYHYIDNTDNRIRGKIMPRDIVNLNTFKLKKTIEEKFGFGSMTTRVAKKIYKDQRGTMILSFDPSLMSQKFSNYANHEIMYAHASYSGKNKRGEKIYFYGLRMQNGAPAISMRITGESLFNAIIESIKHGVFIAPQTKN